LFVSGHADSSIRKPLAAGRLVIQQRPDDRRGNDGIDL
jgi:hypothetical protein